MIGLFINHIWLKWFDENIPYNPCGLHVCRVLIHIMWPELRVELYDNHLVRTRLNCTSPCNIKDILDFYQYSGCISSIRPVTSICLIFLWCNLHRDIYIINFPRPAKFIQIDLINIHLVSFLSRHHISQWLGPPAATACGSLRLLKDHRLVASLSTVGPWHHRPSHENYIQQLIQFPRARMAIAQQHYELLVLLLCYSKTACDKLGNTFHTFKMHSVKPRSL